MHRCQFCGKPAPYRVERFPSGHFRVCLECAEDCCKYPSLYRVFAKRAIDGLFRWSELVTEETKP